MRRRVVTGLLALLAAAMVVLAIRSWTTDERDRARAAVERFGAAVAAKDYGAICQGLLASRLKQSLESVGLPCEEALRQGLGSVRQPRLTVDSVVVVDDRASAAVHTGAAGQPASRDVIQLRKETGEWRITALGAPGRETAGAGTTGSGTTATTTTPLPPGSRGSGAIVPPALDPDAPANGAVTTPAGPVSAAERRRIERRKARQRRLEREARRAQANRGE
ncbi:hypothetical protein [Patulibacter defluvii]|uniref:hypothetical protein n=1 Tax=Patulibacter defluvii TaxID=3095358 RepID=UPI002A751A69|nr:hypothetical protein [Patulibacter sp. DM4]